MIYISAARSATGSPTASLTGNVHVDVYGILLVPVHAAQIVEKCGKKHNVLLMQEGATDLVRI